MNCQATGGDSCPLKTLQPVREGIRRLSKRHWLVGQELLISPACCGSVEEKRQMFSWSLWKADTHLGILHFFFF